MLRLALSGAGFGAWMSAMAGIGLPGGRLERLRSAIEAAELPRMIDVPRERVAATGALVREHHPEALLEGTGTSMPPFP